MTSVFQKSGHDSKYFQKKILIGNMVIAFICGALIYLTYLFDFRIDTNKLLFNADEKGFTKLTLRILEIKFYMVFSFLGTLIREIIKDIEDIDGDNNAGYTTLPITIGKKRASNISFVLMLLFMMLL